jgi:hypothetical protein
MLKKFFIILWSIIGLLILASLFLPKNINLSLAKKINCNNQELYLLISNLNEWKKWAPWSDLNDVVEVLRPTGVGAMQIWREGNDLLKIELTKIELDKRVEYKLSIENEKMAEGKFHLEQDKDENDPKESILTWNVDGSVNQPLLGGVFALILKKQLTAQMTLGLENIKRVCEMNHPQSKPQY